MKYQFYVVLCAADMTGFLLAEEFGLVFRSVTTSLQGPGCKISEEARLSHLAQFINNFRFINARLP